MYKYFLSLLFVILSWKYMETSRILAVIPTPSYSHQVFYQQLWKEIAIRGHEIVVITTDPTNETLPNFREISIREIYKHIQPLVDMMINDGLIQMILQNNVANVITTLGQSLLENHEVQSLIRNRTEQFDLIFVEHFLHPGLGFKHRFNCPMIGVISFEGMFNSHEIMGNADHSILYPPSLVGLSKESTVLQRILTVVLTTTIKVFPMFFLNVQNQLSRDAFGHDTPSLANLMESTDMLFVNANPIFNAIRPVSPSTISIAGGIHIIPEKPLPEGIKDFLDNAEQGAIYFSLGSNLKSNKLPLELQQVFLNTLRQLPYNIVWKYEGDILDGNPKNVMITKWAPQQDILRHKNVKLFITQGGLQSLEEALYSHVPVVVIPFFGDQASNAQKVAEKGMGIVIDKNTITVASFNKTILEIIENPIYGDTVRRLALQIQDTPMTPMERAIWWTEYVIRHKGAQHLKGQRIPWHQYYYLDIFSMCIIFLIIVYVILKGLMVKYVKGRNHEIRKVKKS